MVFADESGNFDFSRSQGASKYFCIGTITVADTAVGDQLLKLRRSMAWEGVHLDAGFHATTDPQAVRDRVFGVLANAVSA